MRTPFFFVKLAMLNRVIDGYSVPPLNDLG
jgi:hypothetical protein